MPLATPKQNEDKDDFINRCMGDDVMTQEFPDAGQRREVCERQWQKKETKDDE